MVMLSPSFAKVKVLHLSAYCHSFRDWGRFCPNNCQTVLDDIMHIQVWRSPYFSLWSSLFFVVFLWSLSRSHPTSPFVPLSALGFVAILSSFCGFGIGNVVSSTSEQKKTRKKKKNIVMLSVCALISYRPVLGRKAIVCSLQYLC